MHRYVEQDAMFIEACKEFFPDTAKGLEDERVHVYNTDALRFYARSRLCMTLL